MDPATISAPFAHCSAFDYGSQRSRTIPQTAATPDQRPRTSRAGITVQRSGKSCGSCSITVDNPAIVNIPVTHTGDFRSAALPLRSSDECRVMEWACASVGRSTGAKGRTTALGPKQGRKRARTCDDPRRGGERGSSPRPTRGGRSRTGLARSRTIRDFHGVPESLLRQTHAPRPYAEWRAPMLRLVENHSLPRTAAFFDLDKTVIAKSSTLTFSKSFYQGGLINRRAVLRTAYAQFVFLAGGADHDQMERMREYLSALCQRLERPAGQGDRRRDAARPDRPDHLRRGRLPHRGAPHRRAGTW